MTAVDDELMRPSVCGTIPVLCEKDGVGFCSPLNRCDASRSSTADPAASLSVPPVLAARTGGPRACRFAQAVPGLQTRLSCRPQFAVGAAVVANRTAWRPIMVHSLGAPAPTPDADESAPLDLHALYHQQEACGYTRALTLSAHLTAETLRALLEYDPETGVFKWRVSRKGPGAKAGGAAGWTRSDGYVSIKINGHKHWAHRLAWLYVYGAWPQHGIDHIDGNSRNNAIVNLRDVPHVVNLHNVRRERSNKTSGLPKGVKRNGRGYAARITAHGKTLSLGQFATPQEARSAYEVAKAIYHEGYVA